MARQMQQTRAVGKPREEHIDEKPERSDGNEVSEQAECCIADIDAAIDEACCILAEVAEVVEPAPTEAEFTKERRRLKSAWYATTPYTAARDEAWAAIVAYENKWPQHAHLCVC